MAFRCLLLKKNRLKSILLQMFKKPCCKLLKFASSLYRPLFCEKQLHKIHLSFQWSMRMKGQPRPWAVGASFVFSRFIGNNGLRGEEHGGNRCYVLKCGTNYFSFSSPTGKEASSSVAKPLDSSTVTIPSLQTFPMASAINWPMSSLFAVAIDGTQKQLVILRIPIAFIPFHDGYENQIHQFRIWVWRNFRLRRIWRSRRLPLGQKYGTNCILTFKTNSS